MIFEVDKDSVIARLRVQADTESEVKQALSLLDSVKNHNTYKESMTLNELVELFQFLKGRRKIPAIKLIRKVYGLGLEGAKEFVEKHMPGMD